MANKDLKDTIFTIPQDVLSHLQGLLDSYDGNGRQRGLSRLKGLIEDPNLTYQQIKRIKNTFDHIDIDSDFEEYRLNGGDRMSKWVNDELDNKRFQVYRKKDIRRNHGEKNQFKKSYNKGSKTLDRDYLIDKITINETIDRIKKLMNL